MSTQIVVCKSEPDAEKLSHDVDAALKLPWPCTFVGGGVHVRQDTLRYADAQKHPDKSQWAYPYLPELMSADEKGKKKIATPADATVEDLTDDWKPSEAKEPKEQQGQQKQAKSQGNK